MNYLKLNQTQVLATTATVSATATVSLLGNFANVVTQPRNAASLASNASAGSAAVATNQQSAISI